MAHDNQKVEDAVLALLQLTASDTYDGEMVAWKNFSWDVTDALYEKGFLADPRGKKKSLILTMEGAERSRRLFAELFGAEGGA